MTTETATNFWQSQSAYPFPFTRKRRIHELNYLLPRLERIGGTSLLDLGCGDGSLLECILRLSDFTELHGCDVAIDLMRAIDPRIRTFEFDISKPCELPKVDATIVAGVIQYVFDDDVVAGMLERITSPVVWVRSTCSLDAQGEKVVRDGYASFYRTLPATHALISRHFKITAVDRIYPDELESKFGTRQFYFEARRAG
jgi:SAM-dependent methyltransferase